LAQYRDKLADETGIFVHPWTVGRALWRLAHLCAPDGQRLTRKKEDPARRRAGRGCDRPARRGPHKRSSPGGLAHRA
jgi:hypothetical protein